MLEKLKGSQKKETCLRGIKVRRPPKLQARRNPVIQPIPGSFQLPGTLPGESPASSYVFLFRPSKVDPNPPAARQ